jgi:hypothetical protein
MWIMIGSSRSRGDLGSRAKSLELQLRVVGAAGAELDDPAADPGPAGALQKLSPQVVVRLLAVEGRDVVGRAGPLLVPAGGGDDRDPGSGSRPGLEADVAAELGRPRVDEESHPVLLIEPAEIGLDPLQVGVPVPLSGWVELGAHPAQDHVLVHQDLAGVVVVGDLARDRLNRSHGLFLASCSTASRPSSAASSRSSRQAT